MKIISMNNKMQTSFESLNIHEESLRKAGENVFEGVRGALIPKENSLYSPLHEFALTSDIYICKSSAPESLFVRVKKGFVEYVLSSFRGQGKSPAEITKSLIDEVTSLYEGASTATSNRSFYTHVTKK